MLVSLTLHSLKAREIEYVTLNPAYKNVYWREITVRIRHQVGATVVTDPATVRSILEANFEFLVEQFQRVIEQVADRLAFLMFVHRIHESSVLISNEYHSNNREIHAQLTEQDLQELPAIRRVLKLIMEAILPERFDELVLPELVQSSQSTRQNVALLEELLYLGVHALEGKEFINIASMFEKSVYIKSSWKKPVTLYTAAPYHHVFRTVQEDIAEYPNVIYEEVNAELDAVLSSAFGSNLTDLLKYMPGLGTGIIPKAEFLQELGFEAEQLTAVQPFLDGLTLSASNKLPLIDSFKKMQTNNRLIYRPLIEFQDRDGNAYWIVGFGKAYESMMALQTNALLWQQLPSEWESSTTVTDFVQELEAKREGLMVAQVAELLTRNHVPHDTGIKSLLGPKNQGFNIVKKGPGEIDVIFLDVTRKKIFVCECKNNRPRFEVFYWKSEYAVFERKYEPQLVRKHEWVSKNKLMLQAHFAQKFGQQFDFTEWTVEGLFLLMTPSFYKYDGLFKALTVTDFDDFLDNDFEYEYPVLSFSRKDGSMYEIEYPYFKNIHRLIAQGAL